MRARRRLRRGMPVTSSGCWGGPWWWAHGSGGRDRNSPVDMPEYSANEQNLLFGSKLSSARIQVYQTRESSRGRRLAGAPCPVGRVSVCPAQRRRSEEHTSELQSRPHLVCRLLLEKKKKKQ